MRNGGKTKKQVVCKTARRPHGQKPEKNPEFINFNFSNFNH